MAMPAALPGHQLRPRPRSVLEPAVLDSPVPISIASCSRTRPEVDNQRLTRGRDACRHVVPCSASCSFSPNYMEISILRCCWGRNQWPPTVMGPKGQGQQWGVPGGAGQVPSGHGGQHGTKTAVTLYAIANQNKNTKF